MPRLTPPLLAKPEASYDIVGRYEQDRVNGLGDALLDELLDHLAPRGAAHVLDAMGGDGNLAARLHRYCQARGIRRPATTMLEFSRVQCAFAEKRLSGLDIDVIWGDALGMTHRDGGAPLPDAAFDRVMIKSANHEIALEQQAVLYEAIHRVLAPGGRFVNLGFVFDDEGERDELRGIARVKDTLAGMLHAATNRHFLTRAELYGALRAAGFVDIGVGRPFEYAIHSHVVAEQYFDDEQRTEMDLEHQTAQLLALRMRESGRIRFEGARSVMRCPGEITVARRPSALELAARAAENHELDILRDVPALARLRDALEDEIAGAQKVLELGCGIGLLAERLGDRFASSGRQYLGVDPDAGLLETAQGRLGDSPALSFLCGSLDSVDGGSFDSAVILGALGREGVDAVASLQAARAALRPGGRLLLCTLAAPDALDHRGRWLFRHCDSPTQLRAAMDRGWATAGPQNFWSREGIFALLTHIGFHDVQAARADGIALDGAAWLVSARA